MNSTTNNENGSLETLQIDDHFHRLCILKHLYLTYGEFEAMDSESVFRIPTIKFNSIPSSDLVICRIPALGNFKLNLGDFDLYLKIINDPNINNMISSTTDLISAGWYTEFIRYSYFQLTYEKSKFSVIQQLIHSAINALPKIKDKINIYVNDTSSWDKNSTINTNELNVDNLFLSNKNHEQINEIIDQFLDQEEILFKKRFGKQHKLNLIFCGIPGSGKSSMIKVLAKRLNRDIYSLNLGNADMKNKDVIRLFTVLTENCILTIEDADSFFDQREVTNTQLNFSTFLNLLDGAINLPNGLITIITANHPEKFDEALIRAGRIDNIIRFEDIDFDQFERAHKAVLGESVEVDRKLFTICLNNKLSMSTLMDVLIKGRKKSAEDRRDMAINAKKQRTFDNEKSMYC